MQFFPNTLPAQTAALSQKILAQQPEFLHQFYLSGGTGLALQLGHRESEDLDFFSEQAFDPKQVEQALIDLGTLSSTEAAPGTLNTYVSGVKLQFLEYPYPLLEHTVSWEGLQLSSTLDIACTKLQTISMRGGKKDFVDLFFLLDLFTLSELLAATQKKYAQIDYSQTHILKSLVYFADAEHQPMPRLLKQVPWETVKQRIQDAVRNVAL